MDPAAKSQVEQAETEIAALLAANEAAKAVKTETTTDDQIKAILDSVEGMKKSIADMAAREAARAAGDDDEDEDDDEDDEKDKDPASATFLKKSLADLDPGDGSRDPGQTALDVSRWLDGNRTIVREHLSEFKAFKKSIDTRLSTLERQIGLLVQLSAATAKKSVETTTAAGETTRGRASKLSVMEPPAGKGTQDDPPSAAERAAIPVKLKSLALKAQKAGLISVSDVALVETYVNGSGDVGQSYGGYGPTLPPKPLMDIILSQDAAAA